MISICVHSTNRGKYLNKFLKSLTQQTTKDFEVVIVDNMSRDNTDEVIQKYKDRLNINHIKFKFKRVSNLNPIAYNLAVENAKYDKIILTVSDVIFELNNVENAIKLFDKKKVIYGRALEVNDSTVTAGIRRFDIEKYPELNEFTNNPEGKAYFKVHEKYPQPVFYIAVLSKELYQSIGGMDERFIDCIASSDVDLGQRLNFVSQTEYTGKLFVYHQKHPTKKIDEKKWNDGIKLRNENLKKAGKGNVKVENKMKVEIVEN